jgi:hypothetical protein
MPRTAILIVWALIVLPLPLLALAWTKNRRPLLPLLILSASAVLLASSGARSVKLLLLGPDYSNRLFIAVGLNILLSLGFTIYAAVKGSFVAIAGMILTLGWVYTLLINSVV